MFYMPSPETSRANLERARNPWTDRSPEESTLIWRLTLQWWLGGQNGRRSPRTQRAWAKELRVSQPYVAKIVRRVKRDWPDLAGRCRDLPEATLADLRLAAESRKTASEPSHPQPQQKLAWAAVVSVDPSHVDEAILEYIGFKPNRPKGWF